MKILRHNRVIRFIHWVTALSIFTLIFTGFGQMPVYRRYNVDKIAGLEWSSDFLITVNIHYIAAIILVFVSFYFLAYLIGSRSTDILPRRGDFKESIQIFASMVGLAEEPENDKYLAEQRLAFAVTAGSVAILIITGLIKVYKNLPGVNLSAQAAFWTAQIHNIFTVILLISIIIHLLAFLIKDNRPLVASMFTGKIDKEYVARRHSKWLARLEKIN
ncbi:cytochrome b/b6 domain-containing protein [Syntrophomonas erecta subsp. sporosyntropha]